MWNKLARGTPPQMGLPKPMGQPAVPPMPPPPSMTPQMGALSSMGRSASAPAPLPTGGTHPTDVTGIRDLTQLPTNPYKMAGIGRIDKFPRLFKNTKV